MVSICVPDKTQFYTKSELFGIRKYLLLKDIFSEYYANGKGAPSLWKKFRFGDILKYYPELQATGIKKSNFLGLADFRNIHYDIVGS